MGIPIKLPEFLNSITGIRSNIYIYAFFYIFRKFIKIRGKCETIFLFIYTVPFSYGVHIIPTYPSREFV